MDKSIEAAIVAALAVAVMNVVNLIIRKKRGDFDKDKK